MKTPPSNALVWFAVLGGGTAWAVQFVVNLAFTFAQCDAPAPRWSLPVHGWEIAISAVAIAVTLAAEGAALRVFRGTYKVEDAAAQERAGKGVSPPLGRISFLSMIALTVNFLALMIIVLTAVGAPLLPVCQQS